MATFSCLHCGVERPYGHDNTTENPLLDCVVCKTQTRHTFKANNDYTVTMVIGGPENKVQDIKFVRSTRA